MKLSRELDYRIRYDVEHDLFHAQNIFNDEYIIKPTFIEYVQRIEEENAELKKEWQDQVQKAADEGYARTLQTMQLTKAKDLLKRWVELYKPKLEGYPITPIQEQTEQFLKDCEVEK